MLKRDNLYLFRQKITSYLGDIESHVIDDGSVKYRYLESGKGNENCIVFLHGLLGTKSQWRGLMEEFSQTHRVISLDIPGLSSADNGAWASYEFHNLANYLNNFLHRLGVDNCSIVGHCVGANLAQQFQSQFASRVDELVLVSPVGMELLDSNVLMPKVSQFRNTLNFDSFDEFNTLVNNLFFQPVKVAKILLELRMKELIRNKGSISGVIKDLEKSLLPTINALQISECHKLIICGDSDIYIDKDEFSFFENCINTEFKVLQQCGHVPFLEFPKKTDQLVRHFLIKQHAN